MAYSFTGWVKSLSYAKANSGGSYKCSFNVENSINHDGNTIGIAFDGDEIKRIPYEFEIQDKELFNFISAHSSDRLEIVFDGNEINKVMVLK